MLTDSQIKFMEEMVEKAKSEEEIMISISTFAIEGALEDIRTLQQQNKQMRLALVIVRDTLALKKYDDRTSHGLWYEADKALQGGEINDR